MCQEERIFSHCKTNEPARQSLPSAPTSQPVPQDILRRWERWTRYQSCMYSQAASFSCCLTKDQDFMATQLKIIQSDKPKGKSANKTQEATEELAYLMTFNQSITQSMSRTMQDLSDCIFSSMANVILECCDSYMAGVIQDSLASLRDSPLRMSSLHITS